MDKYQCRRTNCEKEFDLQTNRTRHEKSCKNGELVKDVNDKSFSCSNGWCLKTVSSKFNYERHVKTCKMKTIFQCNQCPKVFEKASKLSRHKESHEMKPLFSCDNCSNVYQRKDKYELHIFKCQAAVQSTHAISTTGNLPSSDMPSMVNIPSAGKRSNKLFTSFAADLVNSSLCLTLRDLSDD